MLKPSAKNNYFLYEYQLLEVGKDIFQSNSGFLVSLNAIHGSVTKIGELYRYVDLSVVEHRHIGLICDIATTAFKIRAILDSHWMIAILKLPRLLALRKKLQLQFFRLKFLTPNITVSIAH